MQQERFSAKHSTGGVTYWVTATPARPDSQAAIRLQAASRGATRLDYLTAPPTYDFQNYKLQIQSQGVFPEHLARSVRISFGSQTPCTDGPTSNSNPISRFQIQTQISTHHLHQPTRPIAKWPALPASSSSSSLPSSVRSYSSCIPHEISNEALLTRIPVPPVGVLIVAGCGADVLINICLTLLGYVHLTEPSSQASAYPVPQLTRTNKQVHPRPHSCLLHPLRLLQPRRPPDPRTRSRNLLGPCTDGRPWLPGGRLRHHQQPAAPAGRLEGLGQHLLRLPAREDLPAAAGRRRRHALGLALCLS